MKIALDAMGGDHAPGVNLKGARDILAENSEIESIFLTGPADQLKKAAAESGLTDPRAIFIDAPEVVGMEESGAKALRQKKNSSIAIAADLVKKDEAQALVSAGNTGAAVATATVKLRLLKGVQRAGIASPMPNEFGVCNLLDAGANPEAKPSHLLGYAIMGSVYAREVLKVDDPQVGIMSNGEEEEKGTAFTKETMILLKNLVEQGNAPFTLCGNVEGHDLFQTKLDVCLCDGFTGNVLLKFLESVGSVLLGVLRAELPRGRRGKVGSAFLRSNLRRIKKRLDHAEHGGALLLGVNGVAVIGHGSSKALSVVSALRIAHSAASHGVMEDLAALQSGCD